MGGSGIKFGGIGVFGSDDVAPEFNDHYLKSQTQPEIRHLVNTGIFGGLNHAFNTTVAETAGNNDALSVVQESLTTGFLQVFRLYPIYLNFAAVMQPGMR